MTQKEFLEKSFQEVVKQLLDEGLIETKEDLTDFAKSKIDDDDLMTAKHILDAINEDDAEYYIYDYSMGSMETPAGIREKEDVEHLVYDEEA